MSDYKYFLKGQRFELDLNQHSQGPEVMCFQLIKDNVTGINLQNEIPLLQDIQFILVLV